MVSLNEEEFGSYGSEGYEPFLWLKYLEYLA